MQNTRPDIAKEWHPAKNGNLTPLGCTRSSNKKVWWRCDLSHEWYTSVNNRTGNRGRGHCPFCASKSAGENKIQEILEQLGVDFECQKRFDSCRSVLGTSLPFDFCVFINHQEYLIEYQGRQHYEPVRFNAMSFEKAILQMQRSQKTDRAKRRWSHKSNIPLLAIPYWEYKHIEKLLAEFLKT